MVIQEEYNASATQAAFALDEMIKMARGQLPFLDQLARHRAQAPLIIKLPGEQLQQFVGTLLLEPYVAEALQWLHETSILAGILPEVETTVDFTQEVGRRHKDVWKHTKQVVAQTVPRLPLRWAALLHDLGKVKTRVIHPDGKVTFHGHAEVGARIFDRIARRLNFANPLRSEVRFLILHHLRASQYDSQWTDSAVRRFARDMGPFLPALLDLSRADITSAQRQRRENALRQIEELSQRIAVIQEIDSRKPPLPSGLGNEIMSRFALPPGPRIGQWRRELEQAVEKGILEPFHDSDYYLAYLEKVHHDHRGAG